MGVGISITVKFTKKIPIQILLECTTTWRSISSPRWWGPASTKSQPSDSSAERKSWHYKEGTRSCLGLRRSWPGWLWRTREECPTSRGETRSLWSKQIGDFGKRKGNLQRSRTGRQRDLAPFVSDRGRADFPDGEARNRHRRLHPRAHQHDLPEELCYGRKFLGVFWKWYNGLQVESGRRLIPTKLGISLVHGYLRVDR